MRTYRRSEEPLSLNESRATISMTSRYSDRVPRHTLETRERPTGSIAETPTETKTNIGAAVQFQFEGAYTR